MAEANEEKTTVSEETTPVEAGTKTAEELTTLNVNLYTEVKELRKENKERRLKTAEFEADKKTREEANLEATDLIKVRDNRIAELEGSIAKGKLISQFVNLVKEKGFPDKIARLGTPKDLSEDNLLDAVKQFDKEYKEFKPATGGTKPAQPKNPMASSLQPSLQEQTKAKTGRVTGMDAFRSSYDI